MAELSSEQPPPKDTSLVGRARAAVTTFRWWALIPVPVLILIVSSFGPDGWREPVIRMLWVVQVCIFLALSHGARRTLFPTLDLSDMLERAKNGNVAAAIVSAAAMVFMAMVFLGIVSHAKAATVDVRTYIPANAGPLLPLLRDTQRELMPAHPMPSYFGALIEQESCVSLTNARCWNSRAQLKTAREEGAGLGQFTRAYREDGSLRFDAIAEVKALDPVALREFSWSTVYQRADLSLRAIVVKVRDLDLRIGSRAPQMTAANRVAFTDASYNGGLGGMLQDRAICALTAGCNPDVWFGNVENTSNKSRVRWQGYGLSPFAISREHVANVLNLRRAKYRAALGPDLT